MRRIVIISVLLMSLAGCAPMAKVVFGIDEIDTFDSDRVESFHTEGMRLTSCSQIVATAEQVDSLIRLDLDTNMMQHRGQPVQILHFDGDSLVFYHINCYTQNGFLSYSWNNYGSFSTFPPSPTIVADKHGSMSLECFRSIFPELRSQSRYTIIVVWSNILRRVSRKAIEAVATNARQCPSCNVVLINTDHWWVKYLNSEGGDMPEKEGRG